MRLDDIKIEEGGGGGEEFGGSPMHDHDKKVSADTELKIVPFKSVRSSLRVGNREY